MRPTVARAAACCASQVLDRGAQADARGAEKVLGRGAKAVVARSTGFCVIWVCISSSSSSRGASRCALQVLDRGAQAVARGAATLIAVRQGRERRDASAAGNEQLGGCVQRSRVNITVLSVQS